VRLALWLHLMLVLEITSICGAAHRDRDAAIFARVPHACVAALIRWALPDLRAFVTA
jgi:hypothetical protein